MNPIDDMKALIQRRSGIARGNRYGVHFTHPVITNQTSGYNWIQSGLDTWVLCTAVVLPGKRISTTEATHNHHLAKKPYSMATDEVTMSFMLTGDYYMKKYFDVWQEMIVNSSGNHYKTMYKDEYCTDVLMQQLSTSNHIIPGYTLMLENAYPIQVGSINLGNGEDGLMELPITWEYDNFRTINNFDVDVNIKLSINDDGLLEKLNKDKKFDQYRNEEGPPDTTTKNNPFKKQPIAGGL